MGSVSGPAGPWEPQTPGLGHRGGGIFTSRSYPNGSEFQGSGCGLSQGCACTSPLPMHPSHHCQALAGAQQNKDRTGTDVPLLPDSCFDLVPVRGVQGLTLVGGGPGRRVLGTVGGNGSSAPAGGFNVCGFFATDRLQGMGQMLWSDSCWSTADSQCRVTWGLGFTG